MDATKYIGREWIKRKYDCWGLVRDVYKSELGIDIPLVPVDSSNLFTVLSEFKTSNVYSFFEKIPNPINYSIVTITIPGGRHVTHCGIWYESRVLHNTSASGVIFEPFERVPISGCYRYAKDCVLP